MTKSLGKENLTEPTGVLAVPVIISEGKWHHFSHTVWWQCLTLSDSRPFPFDMVKTEDKLNGQGTRDPDLIPSINIVQGTGPTAHTSGEEVLLCKP